MTDQRKLMQIGFAALMARKLAPINNIFMKNAVKMDLFLNLY